MRGLEATTGATLDVSHSSETLSLHPVDSIINTSINNPAKMLALLVMARQPGTTFTTQELMNGLNDAQGDDIGWKWRSSEGLRHYCVSSFIPAGLAVQTERKGAGDDRIAAFQITEAGIEWGVPLFGAILDLELRSDFSSQRTFGGTGSNSGESRETLRTALVRMRILEHVYGAQERPINLSWLRAAIPRDIGAVDHAVEELTTTGILRVLHKTKPADRILSISRPDHKQIARYRSAMSPETAAIYDAAIVLYQRGVRELDGAALLDEAETLLPGVERSRLWRAVADQMPRCLSFADEQRFGSNRGKTTPRTRIEITREYELVIEDLLRSVAAVRDSADYRKIAAAQARQILSQPSAVSYLMSKAQANSRYTGFKRDEALVKMDRLAGKLLGWVSLRRLLTMQADWRDDAACRKVDPELFFGLKDEMSEVEAERARAVCADCISRLHCLKWAVEQPEIYGMWGGHTETERRNLSKDTRIMLDMVKLVV